MTHQWCLDRLGPYLDRELQPAEASRIESHVEQCAPCRRELTQLERVSGMVRDMPREKMPPDLMESLRRAARRNPAAVSTTWRPWAFGSLAAAAVVVLLVAVRTQPVEEPAEVQMPRDLPGSAVTSPGRDAAQEPEEDRTIPLPRREPAAGSAVMKDRLDEKEDAPRSNEAAPADEAYGFAPAPPPEARGEMSDERRQPATSSVTRVYRYVTRLEGSDLAPLRPVDGQRADSDDDGAVGGLAARKRSAEEGETAGKPSPAAAAAPPPGQEKPAAPGTRLYFLAETDAEGRITSASLTGARTVPQETVDAIETALVGQVVPSTGVPVRLIIEVAVPEDRANR